MNRTVLIIDDDDVLRDTLARGLRNEGFNVITANDTESGTATLSRTSVDAIVLDRMMVGMDGLTFLKQMRTHGDTTPVIMLTAMTGPENTIDGLAGGANDYLAKPFQLRELVLRLNNIIKTTKSSNVRMPGGMIYTDNEFFIVDTHAANQQPKLLALSGEEKKLLKKLTHPVGNIAPAAPMVAKRLRNKLNIVLSNIDIITVRGHGYKLIDTSTPANATKQD